MDIRQFVNQDIAAYLAGFRPLEGWEQLHIVFHADRPLREKRAAYEALLVAYGDNEVLAGHLRRHMRMVDAAQAALRRVAPRARTFVAETGEGLFGAQGGRTDIPSQRRRHFATFERAKRWLDRRRKEAEEGQTSHSCQQYIYECSETWVYGWWVCDGIVLTEGSDGPDGLRFPEHRYVHLPGVFQPGDVLLVRGRGDRKGEDAYAVAMCANGNLGPARIDHADDSDACVTVMCFDLDAGTVWHEHWPLWRVERLRGDLPRSQEALLDISRHFTGEKRLSEAEIRRLDPRGLLNWRGSL